MTNRPGPTRTSALSRAGAAPATARAIVLALCCAAALLATAGCGGDDPGGPGTPGSGHITLTLDGTRHVFDGSATGLVARAGLLQLGAIKGNGSELVTLAVPDAVGTGPLGIDGGVNLNISVGGVPYTATDQAGTITVTAVSANRVSGTFSGNVVHPQDDTITGIVTDGSFDVPVSR